MTYQDAISYLFRLERFGWKLGLDRMNTVLSELGEPQNDFDSIHIAGSNGKGSVAAMLASILTASGYKCGLYTSPHLVDARERMRIGRKLIEESELVELVRELRPLFDRYGCTFFEALTILAFAWFSRQKVDIAVIEVGLGGRLDATNVISPLLSIITTISMEHTDHLGDSLEKIAAEKAGIIKKGVPCLCGWMPPVALKVIAQIADSRGSQVSIAEENLFYEILEQDCAHSRFRLDGFGDEPVTVPSAGMHQVRNACLAIWAAKSLASKLPGIEGKSIRKGLGKLEWPGRFQIYSTEPLIILDVAHNPQSMEQLVQTLKTEFPDKEPIFVMGLLKDKDMDEIAKILSSACRQFYLVKPKSDRGAETEDLASRFRRFGCRTLSFSSPIEAIRAAIEKMSAGNLLCVAGSHYVVGETLEQIKDLTL